MIKLFMADTATEFTPAIICKFMQEHAETTRERYNKLMNYYEGKHSILDREKRSALANNRLVCNHAKYITKTATGYFIGTPIQYSSADEKVDISAFTDILKYADSDTQDVDLAIKASIFGVCYEFIYATEEKPKLFSPDPRNAFVIYDDTVEQKPIAGVYYYKVTDGVNKTDKGYSVYYSTPTEQVHFMCTSAYEVYGEVETTPNAFGGVQVIEIYNNMDCTGDFEDVTSLIDAYNILQSDRINDKEQFVEAILLIKGQILGDTNEETSEAYKALKENGLLTLDESSSAEWLTRQFDENSVEVLRHAVEQDIHKFSSVPCMSDTNFAGNVSGIAMRYKLLGFEQLVKVKENYFREGLRERIRLLCNYINKVGLKPAVDPSIIRMKFSRALPVNELERAQQVALLDGKIPLEILLGMLPDIEDVKKAKEDLEAEKAKATEMQTAAFMNTPFTPRDEE